MKFAQAVEQADAPLCDALRPGLRAISRRDRARVLSRRDSGPTKSPWTGSVDLDAAIAPTAPQAPRWDYGIGYVDARGHERALWIEVHSAHTKHADEVLAKLSWLKGYLEEHARELATMSRATDGEPAFFWLARGGIDIRPGTSEERRLMRSGLRSPRAVLALS